jgi:hypothetical protein
VIVCAVGPPPERVLSAKRFPRADEICAQQNENVPQCDKLRQLPDAFYREAREPAVNTHVFFMSVGFALEGANMKNTNLKAVSVTVLVLAAATTIFAQVTPPPSPGPTNAQVAPGTKSGTDLVINPTEEECKKGWNASMKWTREQFEQLCATLRAAK